MKTGTIVRYTIAWLGFVAMGYGLTLMFAKRDEPAASAAQTASTDASADIKPDTPLNNPTGANINDIDIALATLDGGEKTLAEFAGRPVVVNFWATWCGPCRKEIPLLKALQEEYAEQEVSIVGVAIDELDAVREYSQQMNFNYPVLVGEDSGFRVASAIGVSNLYVPITAFVDRSGVVKRIHTGEIMRDDAEFGIAEIVAR